MKFITVIKFYRHNGEVSESFLLYTFFTNSVLHYLFPINKLLIYFKDL